jgi:hypothetical protein
MHQSNYYDEEGPDGASYSNSLVRYLVLSLIVTNYIFYE